jgi:hypothetical protein
MNRLWIGMCAHLALAAGISLPHASAVAQSPGYQDLNTTIFTKDNQRVLCTKQGNDLIVKREQLAYGLVNSRVSLETLRYANAAGIKDEILTARNYIYFVSSPKPFGENVLFPPGMQRDLIEQASIRTNFYLWLAQDSKRNSDYEVVPATLPAPDPQRYFQDQSPYEIRCKTREASSPDGTPPGGADKNADPAAWLKNVVVRKTVADIAVPSTQLKKTNGAQFSYVNDVEGHKRTASIEGVVGLVLAGTGADRAQELGVSTREPRDLLWWNFTPYVYYKRVDVSPNTSANKDTNYVTPGFSGNVTWVDQRGFFAFDLQLDGAATLDSIWNSTVYSGGLRFAPSFLVNSTVVFGAPLAFGFFSVRPDLALVVREYVIDDPGTNPALLSQKSYSSFGFDAKAQLYFATEGSVLPNLIPYVGYVFRENTGGAPDVRRFTAGLSYIPGFSDNITFDLDYIDGRDVSTLQNEKRVTASITFRY